VANGRTSVRWLIEELFAAAYGQLSAFDPQGLVRTGRRRAGLRPIGEADGRGAGFLVPNGSKLDFSNLSLSPGLHEPVERNPWCWPADLTEKRLPGDEPEPMRWTV